MLGHPAAGRRGIRRRRLHPRLPGRARQVQIGRRLRDDAPGSRAAESDGDGPRDRRLRHDRLAGEEYAGIERTRGHDRLFLRRLHGGDGAARSASRAQGRGAGEPDGGRLDGRRLVPLRRFSANQFRLHHRADDATRMRASRWRAMPTTTTRPSGARGRRALTRGCTAWINCRGRRR